MAYEARLKDEKLDSAVDDISTVPGTKEEYKVEQTTTTSTPVAQPQYVETQPGLLNPDGTLRDSDVYSRYREKVAQRGSARMALAEMMRPEDETKRERSMRRVALGQAVGDIIGGLFGFGIAQKNGSPVVVPESQATKTQARLQKLQEQGLADRDEYRKLLANLRMKDLDDDVEAERWIAGQEASRAERDAARAHQLSMAQTKYQIQAERDAKKDAQWQEQHNERKRHNKAMEANAKLKGGRSGNGAEDGYAAYLRPSERLVSKTTDDGSLVGGKKTTTYRERMPNITKEERMRWNAIAGGIVHALGADEASDYEISALLTPIRQLLSDSSVNEAAVSDLIQGKPGSYDVLTTIVRENIPFDGDVLNFIRDAFDSGYSTEDVIDMVRAADIARKAKEKENSKSGKK